MDVKTLTPVYFFVIRQGLGKQAAGGGGGDCGESTFKQQLIENVTDGWDKGSAVMVTQVCISS